MNSSVWPPLGKNNEMTIGKKSPHSPTSCKWIQIFTVSHDIYRRQMLEQRICGTGFAVLNQAISLCQIVLDKLQNSELQPQRLTPVFQIPT